MLRSYPTWTHAARDQELDGRERDEGLDEVLRLRLRRDLVVVVEDEPGVRRPLGEVFAENLGEGLRVLGGSRKRTQVLAESVVAVVDEGRGGGLRDAERESRDIGGRRTRRVPDADAPVAYDPLLGERGLPVPGRSDQRADARLGLVEEREQPGPLDDPALSDPWFGDCGSRRLS